MLSARLQDGRQAYQSGSRSIQLDPAATIRYENKIVPIATWYADSANHRPADEVNGLLPVGPGRSRVETNLQDLMGETVRGESAGIGEDPDRDRIRGHVRDSAPNLRRGAADGSQAHQKQGKRR